MYSQVGNWENSAYWSYIYTMYILYIYMVDFKILDSIKNFYVMQ